MVSSLTAPLLRNQDFCPPPLPAEKYGAAQNVLQNCTPQNTAEMSTFRELSVKTLLGRCVASPKPEETRYRGRQLLFITSNLLQCRTKSDTVDVMAATTAETILA